MYLTFINYNFITCRSFMTPPHSDSTKLEIVSCEARIPQADVNTNLL